MNGRYCLGGALELFTLGPDKDSSPEIVLSSSEPEDVERRIRQALRTLSSVTGMAVERLAHDISMFDYDLLRARLPGTLVLRDSIHLRIAEKFIVNARKFLTSAAAAEIRKVIVVPDNQSAGAEYANSCRLGHTFKGSFGFTIESPAGPAAQTLDGEAPPAPLERRVIERIARGLTLVEKATAVKSAEPLLIGASEGFNFNMLSDFTTWIADTSAGKIKYDITLTPAWAPSPDIRLSAEIEDTALPILDSAISQLGPAVGPVLVTVVGQVVRLETREIPANLLDEGRYEIGLEGASSETGSIALRVRLSAEDYLLAVDAHRNGRVVAVTGEIGRASKSATMLQPSSFRVF
ncbi:hypothetical protein IC608_12320 [Devosia sp. PTR5]|uniref:Uncharacterized protein n=2 Tax=Devosia oryzisoli TaxID=2774138 RepID=A0A927IR24_9HYPH|nr:hypothetical protein [Devosia oryzisoli]